MHTCNDLSQCPLSAKKCGGIEVQGTAWMNASSNMDSKGAYRG